MNPEVLENLLFILVGWLLSTFTTFIAFLVNKRRKKRKVFTDLKRVIENLIIQIELSKAWREVGGIETVPGLFEMDESWKTSIPIEPPNLSEEFQSVVKSVSEWEAQKGDYSLTKKLSGIKNTLKILESIHSGFISYAKQKESDKIPDRTLQIYKSHLDEFHENNKTFFSQIIPYQKTWLFRKKDKIIDNIRMQYNIFKKEKVKDS